MYMELEFLFYVRAASVLIAILFPVFICWYSTRNYNYWRNKGITYIKPYPYFIYLLEIFRRGITVVELERYKKYGKIYGFNEGNTPLISVADPQIIKNIVVKDFQYFTNKRLPARYVLLGINSLPIGDPIGDKMLTNIGGEEWKRIRTIVSPAFSTGKLKRVMHIIHDSAKTLLQNLKMEMANKGSVELLRIYGAFTMDVITSAAFSTKIDSLKCPDNVVVQKAKAASNPNLQMHYILFCLAPKIMKLLGIVPYSSENKFFKKLFIEIIKERKKPGQTRNDFLQLLLDLSEESEKEKKSKEKDGGMTDSYKCEETDQSVFTGTGSKHLSMDELVAQCVIFLLGGYHTTKSTGSAATHLLATHQDEQEKVFQEIKEVLRETDGVLTYEAIQKMKYLDYVISETLRLYPPSIKIERQAEIDYKLGDTGITIPKGMAVTFPVFAMHRDPEFFPEPEKFKPSRFSPKERENLIPYTYMPFALGPRNCIGMKFALLELKICLVHVFSVFRAEKCPETKVPLEFDRGMGILTLAPMHIRLEERKECPLVLSI